MVTWPDHKNLGVHWATERILLSEGNKVGQVRPILRSAFHSLLLFGSGYTASSFPISDLISHCFLRPSDGESFLLCYGKYVKLCNLLESRDDFQTEITRHNYHICSVVVNTLRYAIFLRVEVFVETEIANTENQKRPAPRSQSRLVGVENSADHIAQSAGHSSAAKSILSYSQEPMVRGSRSSAFDAGKANRRNHQEDSTSSEATAVDNTLH